MRLDPMGVSAATMTDEQRCHAHSRPGERCGRVAVAAGVCDLHGGKSPNAIRAQANREAIAEANELLGLTGEHRVVDPFEAYSTLVSEAEGWRQHCKVKLAEVEEYRYESGQGGTEQLRSEVALWERALDRSGKLIDRWISFGFEERRVSVIEADAREIAGVMGAYSTALFALVQQALAAGELTAAWLRQAQQELAPRLMRAELTAAGARAAELDED